MTALGKQNRDCQRFFDAIDAPLSYICGSCGALSNPKTMKTRVIDDADKFFDPLRIGDDDGKKNIAFVEAAIVEEEVESVRTKRVPLCHLCWKALQTGKAPKFSRAAGFRISNVPEELAVLNNLEARTISLGVCFVTCYRVNGGQDFTTGTRSTTGTVRSKW